MYLKGRKSFWNTKDSAVKEDGFEVSEHILELGYWRKHPNLHGFIVQNFAAGEDKCQEIFLSAENIQTVIQAVRKSQLPHTEGFFFGDSDGTESEEDIKIFNAALEWLKVKKQHEYRSIYYRASW